MPETLVVALDGMDKQLIEEFELEFLTSLNFGTIDNHTEVSDIKTSELFASFITGSNHEEHGIDGLMYDPNPRKRGFLDSILPENQRGKVRGLQYIYRSLKAIMNIGEKKIYDESHLEASTLFDEIDNSRAMFVPSYNPSPFWVIRAGIKPLEYGFTPSEVVQHYDTREWRFRKNSLESELDFMVRPFLMCHFHRPDLHHHMYGDPDLQFDKKRLRKLYLELDEFCSNIYQKAQSAGYQNIIFMSDHGLPEGHSHNKNAFYSTNMDLDGPKHITEFYDIIKEEFKNEGA